ncbi:MAG: BREX-1 system adenine-specific DNA-methyltransferase PglX [Deltaproteobacteria bacterium]|nr:BREX-1 system adenine-specific DNA-methyltransferase PglX [Deltaproteobacteria bacterium]
MLNRLAAVRMAEKRGLIVEAVGNGYQSKGFKVFEQVAGSGLGETYNRYRRYLFCLFDELGVDLGVLFDRRSPQGLLFPREPALLGLLDLLNASDLDALWAEDEAIGWIYQYYNDPAERKKMRDASSAPRNSRELAVRNQFFTPRYVVEFLTDNTLGRIWYEMTRGKTRLKEQCRYLVRRPTEIFLKPGETAPVAPPRDNLSQEELLKEPVYIPHREIKDPRMIRMLDPACGSMHFGLYAFDLYEVIYEEAWDLGLESLRRDFPDKDTMLREVPRLIIEHNIHGIDIDLRCTQIAGLSLWLRAQKSWQTQKLPSGKRPHIRRSNIVCAEPMPGDKAMLKEFDQRQFSASEQPAFAHLLETVFEKMELAGEAGSLLKIEEEIRSAVEEARKLWEKVQTKPRELFSTEEINRTLRPGAQQKLGSLEKAVSQLSTDFWETAEERIYSALRAYAEHAENGGSYQRRLFTDDTVRGFAFVNLCRAEYDVVLMNPPFGEVSSRLITHLDNTFPAWNRNVLCAFIEQQIDVLSSDQCFIGSVIDRTILNKSTYELFRTQVLLSKERLSHVLDLGWEVLDANVEVASVIATRSRPRKSFTHCLDLRNIPPDYKDAAIIETFQGSEGKSNRTFTHPTASFEAFPNHAVVYDLPDSLLTTFSRFQDLRTSGFTSYTGHQLESFRHFMLFWEIPIRASVSQEEDYCHLYNGGEFSRFSLPPREVVRFGYFENLSPKDVPSYTFVLRNREKHFKRGVGFGVRGEFLDAHILSPGQLFTVEGQFLLVEDHTSAFFLLGLLNSAVASRLLNSYSGQHKYSGYVNLLPCPSLTKRTVDTIAQLSLEAVDIKRSTYFWDETSLLFCAPIWTGSMHDAFSKLTLRLFKDLEVRETRLVKIVDSIDSLVYSAYGLKDNEFLTDIAEYKSRVPKEELPGLDRRSSTAYGSQLAIDLFSYSLGTAFGRWDIRYATGEKAAPELPNPFAPLPVRPPGMLQNADGLPATPKDVPVDYPLRISWSGILVDDENQPEDIVSRVEDALKVIWKDRWESIEHEACELLGVKSLRDYFRRPAGFFADHLKRYSKSRRQAPIYWPLSTESGSYTLWIYYHRLTENTLHTALADFIDPKLRSVRTEISSLRDSGSNRARLEELLDLAKELEEFRTEIERIIKLPWKPNLNDGVLITASPLWKLFRLPKWQTDLKACWDKLSKGDYDWAHLAYTIWPDRVKDICKTDRSIAIAHGLEHLCKVEPPKAKGKRKRKSKSSGRGAVT